jgi:hypothetical protein
MPNDIYNSNKLQSYPPYTLPFGDIEIVSCPMVRLAGYMPV